MHDERIVTVNFVGVNATLLYLVLHDVILDQFARLKVFKFYWRNGILVILYVYDITVMRYSFGLGESSLDHRRREEFPATFTIVVSL